MDHEFKFNVINVLKESIYLKNFVGETDLEDTDIILFFLAFILLLRKKSLQLVPFEFELILKQPLLNKFDTQDWEALLLAAVDMNKGDRVIVEVPEDSVFLGQALTKTEMIVALLLCNDLTDKEVADQAFKEVNCVRKHHTNINTKLGTHSSLGIYKKMISMGLILPPKTIAA